jgi:hypothetical protein
MILTIHFINICKKMEGYFVCPFLFGYACADAVLVSVGNFDMKRTVAVGVCLGLKPLLCIENAGYAYILSELASHLGADLVGLSRRNLTKFIDNEFYPRISSLT